MIPSIASGQGVSPPKPRLVLRIGVTGHRPNNFTESARARVYDALTPIFAEIRGLLGTVHVREQGIFAPEAPQIRIVSALAEGADRVVVHKGLEAGFALDVILPFPQEIYEKDFAASSSKEEFHALLLKAHARLVLPGESSADDADKANRAYESAGLMTLRQCDLLIAIWDGKGSSGRGGTEQIVQRAVQSRIPVLRFDADGNGPYALIAEGQEIADAVDLAIGAASDGVVETHTIAAIVEQLVSPPRKKPNHPAADNHLLIKSRGMLLRFLAERQRRWLAASFAYPLLLATFAGKSGLLSSLRMKPYVRATAEDWSVYLNYLSGPAAPLSGPIRDLVMIRFAWADKLANYYGQLHRSGYVANFALSALAVACAGIAIISHSSNDNLLGFPVRSLSFPVIELAIALTIIISTAIGRAKHWHQRWLDYRLLSEQLRQLRALVLTGSSGEDARLLHSGDTLQPGSIWASWYYAATCREAGMPAIVVDRKYVDVARDAIVKCELESQIRYHRANADRMRLIEHNLKLLGEGSFWLTVMCCVVALLAEYFSYEQASLWQSLISGFSITLPAVGASAFGIRVQGDFEGSAARSDEMWRRLQRLQSRMSRKDISFSELSSLAEEAAATMTLELGDFSFIYRSRPLALPA